MANPLPNEEELFERIKKEKISIDPKVWDLIYHKIGDNVSAINLLCEYYLNNQEDIPIKEAEKIIEYCSDIAKMIREITCVKKENFPFPEIKENIPLDPTVRELLTHHIYNDLNVIMIMVSFFTDPDMPQPVPCQTAKKVILYTQAMREFLEKLREATCLK